MTKDLVTCSGRYVEQQLLMQQVSCGDYANHQIDHHLIQVWVGIPMMVISLGTKGTRTQSPCSIRLGHSTSQALCMDPTGRAMQCIQQCMFQAKNHSARYAWRMHVPDR